MKNTLKNTFFAIALFSAPLASFAAQDDASAADRHDLPPFTVTEILSLPEPVHYPTPTAGKDLIGTSIKVKFRVNREGRTESVRLDKPMTSYRYQHVMDFASQLQAQVENWKFEPAQDKAGNAVAVDVILPVKVIEKSGSAAAMASLVLDTSKGKS